MTNFNIATFNGNINNQSVQLINARELYSVLQVKRDFSNWIKDRINDFGFIENEDFIRSPNLASGKNQGLSVFFGGNNKIDYHITLDMAKELCMLERSELGRKARRHFIEKEKQALALAAQNAQLLAKIPPFLLTNPDHTTAIIARAQQAFFTLHPECRELQRYRDLGLTNAEIGKLLGFSRDAVRHRLTKMFALGMATRKNNNQHTVSLGGVL